MRLRDEDCGCPPCPFTPPVTHFTVFMKNTTGNGLGGGASRPFMFSITGGIELQPFFFNNPWGYDYDSPLPQQGPSLFSGLVGYLMQETASPNTQHLIVRDHAIGSLLLNYTNGTPDDIIRGVFSDGVDWFLLMAEDSRTNPRFSWYVRKVDGTTGAVLAESDLFSGGMKGNPDLGEPLVPRGNNNEWMTATMLSDGRIAVGGDFWFVGAVERPRIAVLNNDLTLDAGFDAQFDSTYIYASTWMGPDGPYSILEYAGNLYLWILTTRSFVDSFPCTTFFGGVARRCLAQVDMVTGALGSFQPFSSGWSGSITGPPDDGLRRTFPKGEPPYELRLRMEASGATFGATASAASDEFTCSSHGLTNGQRVRLSEGGAGTFPDGPALAVYYYVRDVTANTFRLSWTNGGAAIDILTDGTCEWERGVPWLWFQGGSYLGGVLATSYFTRINLEDGTVAGVTLPPGFFTSPPAWEGEPFSFEFAGDDLVIGLAGPGQGGGYTVAGSRPYVTRISLTTPGFTDTAWPMPVLIGGPGTLGQTITVR